MKINQLYNEKFVISFEIFPPKTPAGETNLQLELSKLTAHKPDFVSVTYGAGGSSRNKTLDIALQIQDEFKIMPIVHFTCVGSSKDDIYNYLKLVKSKGINNILALRGDPPAGDTKFIPHPDGFKYANELIEFIREIDGFTIAAAGYPEIHTEAVSMEQDLLNLKKKIDAGADFILTQLFYNNNAFYDFVNRAQQIGINVPIIPGIMPITSKGQIAKLKELSGAIIPENLLDSLNRCSSLDEERQAGLDYSVNQCAQLKSWGVKGLHIYTMNKSEPITSIMKELGI